MRDRSGAVDREHAFECHAEPFAVALFPIERCLPAFAIDSCPAVRKPEGKGLVASIFNECDPFSIRDEAVCEPERMGELPVPRQLIVPCEPSAAVAYLVNATRILGPTQGLSLALIRLPARLPVGWPQRICREKRK